MNGERRPAEVVKNDLRLVHAVLLFLISLTPRSDAQPETATSTQRVSTSKFHPSGFSANSSNSRRIHLPQRRYLAQGFDGLPLERQLVHCALRATINIAIRFYSFKLIALLYFASWSEEMPQQACMHLRRRRLSRIRMRRASNGRSRIREKRLRDVKYNISEYPSIRP